MKKRQFLTPKKLNKRDIFIVMIISRQQWLLDLPGITSNLLVMYHDYHVLANLTLDLVSIFEKSNLNGNS